MSAARGVGTVVGVGVLAASGTYVALDLIRWEWTRAILTGVLFLAAEIALGFVHLGGQRPGAPAPAGRHDRIIARLHGAESAPATPVFAWLRPDPRNTNVFVPLLMGAGLVLSGLAWVVERLARATAGLTSDRVVARRLAELGPPAGGLLDPGADPLHRFLGPSGVRR